MEVSKWLRGAIVACTTVFSGCANQQHKSENDVSPRYMTEAGPIKLNHDKGYLPAQPEKKGAAAENTRQSLSVTICNDNLGDDIAHYFLKQFLEQEETKDSALNPDEVQEVASKRLDRLKSFYGKLLSCENNNDEINVLFQDLQKAKIKTKSQIDRLYNLLIVSHYKTIAEFYNENYFQEEVGRLVAQKFYDLPEEVIKAIEPIDLKGMSVNLSNIFSTKGRILISYQFKEDLLNILGFTRNNKPSEIEKLAESIFKEAYYKAIVERKNDREKEDGKDLNFLKLRLGS